MDKEPSAIAPPADITAWKDKSAHARMIIMQNVSSIVMEDLTGYTTIASMWKKL
jgi:hypothetical protein